MTASSRGARLGLLALLGAIALTAGCGGVDAGDYVAANEGVLASIPVYPGAEEVRTTAAPYFEEGGPLEAPVGFTTNAVYSLPPGTSASSVAGFYRERLAPEWALFEEIEGPVLNFRRGNGFVSVNLDNVTGIGTYELGIDHAFFGKLGRA